MADMIASINVIDRSTFNNLTPLEKKNNLYFVREGTQQTAEMLSFYFGDKRECDVMDITGFIDYDLDDPEHNYNIPSQYQVKNKVILAKQDTDDGPFYRAFIWNGEQFVDCFGDIRNVYVCETLPSISNAIKDSIYITLDTKWIYVFDGHTFIKIISTDKYATVEYVDDIYELLLELIENSAGGNNPDIVSVFAENTVMDDVHGKFSEVFYPIEEGTGTVYQYNKWTGSVGGYLSLSSNEYCLCESLPKIIKAGKVYTFTTSIDNSLMQWFFLDENGIITAVSSEYWFPITIDTTSWTEDRYIITTIRNNSWRYMDYNGNVTITIT